MKEIVGVVLIFSVIWAISFTIGYGFGYGYMVGISSAMIEAKG